MQAKELMSVQPRSVRTTERLDAAARVLWENDCGFCPVVDASGALVGVLTDRDLCMAAYTQGRLLGEIPVGTVMSRTVRTCRAEDSVAAVLQTMQQAQVHRLPVVDARGVLVGVVSTNDLVRASHARPAELDPVAVVRTLATIGSPRRHGNHKVGPAASPGPAATTPAAKAAPAPAAAAPAPAVEPAPAVVPVAAKAPAGKAPAVKGKTKAKSRKG